MGPRIITGTSLSWQVLPELENAITYPYSSCCSKLCCVTAAQKEESDLRLSWSIERLSAVSQQGWGNSYHTSRTPGPSKTSIQPVIFFLDLCLPFLFSFNFSIPPGKHSVTTWVSRSHCSLMEKEAGMFTPARPHWKPRGGVSDLPTLSYPLLPLLRETISLLQGINSSPSWSFPLVSECG